MRVSKQRTRPHFSCICMFRCGSAWTSRVGDCVCERERRGNERNIWQTNKSMVPCCIRIWYLRVVVVVWVLSASCPVMTKSPRRCAHRIAMSHSGSPKKSWMTTKTTTSTSLSRKVGLCVSFRRLLNSVLIGTVISHVSDWRPSACW